MAFNSSPLDVTTSAGAQPKDRYKVAIGAPSPWLFQKEGKAEQYGVRYVLTILEGPRKGKKIFFNGNLDNDIGASVMKRLQGAARGHVWKNEDQEEEYNKVIASEYTDPANDFRYDPQTKEVGKYYQDAKGNVIWIDVDINQSNDGSGREFQKFVGFYPLNHEFND